MESYLMITQINDFIFCPRSLLFHDFLRSNYSPDNLRETPQVEITNSQRILNNIRIEIRASFERKFSQGDSVLIIQIPDNAITDRFGYAANEETDLLFF